MIEKPNDKPAAGSEGEQTFYLRSFTEELMGWSDPRAKLEKALREDQFLLFAQKIHPLKPELRECYEILLRLREEEDNLLPPGGFIPVAESYGMMEDIDRWVVGNLIKWCEKKQQAELGWRMPLFSVNLSAAAFASKRFTAFARAELEKTRLGARWLSFELNDTDVIEHPELAAQFAAALKPLGCRFTIDAFGSVKVSFSHLRGLAVDFLKIDGSIILNILRDPAELAKVKAINAVCQKFGMRTIAEFVETRDTYDTLCEIGIDYVQGFGIARPVPISALG
jgi:EAL domain-containing protein (putative c-di-GMP-specific phosphodiesterase class I)